MSNACALAPNVAVAFAHLEAIANDPTKLAAFKAECHAKAKAQMPWMNDAQLEAHWRYTASLFFL